MAELLIDLIKQDAADLADKSGKTELDTWIESHLADGPSVAPQLLAAVRQLDGDEWKQWRAFRQIVRRLKIAEPSISNELAVLTENGLPKDARARFYAYLSRKDLGAPPPMAELLEDNELRTTRPADWLSLAYDEATGPSLHSYYMQAASGLKAKDFSFSLDKLRAKYAGSFLDNLTALCLIMPFKEADELAKMIDEDYRCDLHSLVLSAHSALRPTNVTTRAADPSFKVVAIFPTLNDGMKQRLGQR
ncbi:MULTISPECIES: hypothetical protein [unclassified Bradyrhizobium]|uniref:hypothetical protein n=1 Tax=unclassified Bradyrhizobium TaxID=2631580 RepID=UPI002915F5D9|nr:MULTISPECIES: hypothetical protein [unclassified Bradyrhizobium]